MSDEDAAKLLELLDRYVTEFGGPNADAGEINPHRMTLAELKIDLSTSLGIPV